MAAKALATPAAEFLGTTRQGKQAHLAISRRQGGLAYAKGDGLPTLKLAVGSETFDAHIDSGAPGALTLPDKARGKLSYIEEPVVVGHGRTVNFEFKVWRGKLDGKVKLGTHIVQNPTLGFISMLDSTGYANIGTAFLRDFAVTFDHKANLVRFTRG